MDSELQSGSRLPGQARLVSLTLIRDTDIYLEGVERPDPVTSVLEMQVVPEVTGRAQGSLGRVMTPSPQLAGHVSWHSPRQEGKLAPQVQNDSRPVVPRAVTKPHPHPPSPPPPPMSATPVLRRNWHPTDKDLTLLNSMFPSRGTNSQHINESHRRAWGE